MEIHPVRENRTLRVVNITYTGERLNVIQRITFYDMFRNEVVVSKEFPLIHWQCMPLSSSSVVATTLRYGQVDSVDQTFPWWQTDDTLVARPTQHPHLSLLEGGKSEWAPSLKDTVRFALKAKVVKAYIKGDRMEMYQSTKALIDYANKKEKNLRVVPRPPNAPGPILA